MTSRAVAFAALVVAIGFLGAAVVPAWAEGGDEAALAAAMKNASATLQGGLKASEAQGTPISAKFEIEDGKLQLSVYTMKGNDFMEVVADPFDARAFALLIFEQHEIVFERIGPHQKVVAVRL